VCVCVCVSSSSLHSISEQARCSRGKLGQALGGRCSWACYHKKHVHHEVVLGRFLVLDYRLGTTQGKKATGEKLCTVQGHTPTCGRGKARY
jgi:hypothetical protein